MPKKVKSFALDEEPYEKLSSKFKENYVDVTISYCLNKYIKELLQYLEAVQKGIEESLHTIPMAFVIESITREPVFKVLELDPRPGESESSLEAELNELQRRYDAHIKRNPEVSDFRTTGLDKTFSISTMFTLIGKAMLKETKDRRDMTDDEYLEVVRSVGGKELQKYIREKVAPAFDKIDPVKAVKKMTSGKKEPVKKDE